MSFNVRMSIPLLALLSTPLAAQKQFEGTVTYRANVQGQTMEMTHRVKGEDIRVDMNMQGQSLSLLLNKAGTKQIALMHDTREWMDVKALMDQMSAMMAQMGRGNMQEEEADVDVENLDIRATGQKETIAGRACEHYMITSDGNEIDVCAATGLGWYFGTAAMGNSMMAMTGRGRGMEMGRGRGRGNRSVPGLSNAQIARWQARFADGFFPLKITVTGETPVDLVVTELREEQLDLPLFRPPADYRERGMGGGLE